MNPTTAAPPTASQEVLEAHREHLLPAVAPYYKNPLVLEEGEGVWVRDADGREYLDFFAGILTTSPRKWPIASATWVSWPWLASGATPSSTTAPAPRPFLHRICS